jgi:hypothetical protein
MPKDHHYSRKSDASRAAEKKGLKEGEYEIVGGPKGYTYRTVKQYVAVPNAKLHVGQEPEMPKEEVKSEEQHEVGELTPENATIATAPAPTSVPTPPEANELPPTIRKEMEAEGIVKSADIVEMSPFAPEKHHPHFSDKEVQDIRDGAYQNQQDQVRRQTTNHRGEQIPHPKRSTIESPTKTVWVIADEMMLENPKVPRRDVIAACVNRGIAYFTARTQYQQWLQARRESIEHAAQVNKR